MLEEYDDSDPLPPPLDDPEPDELSRFFFATFLSIREGGGEVFLRLSVGTGDVGFFSIVRGRAVISNFGLDSKKYLKVPINYLAANDDALEFHFDFS